MQRRPRLDGLLEAAEPVRGACSQMLRANLDRMARRIDPLTNLPLPREAARPVVDRAAVAALVGEAREACRG